LKLTPARLESTEKNPTTSNAIRFALRVVAGTGKVKYTEEEGEHEED
jgi:hypothetical protein